MWESVEEVRRLLRGGFGRKFDDGAICEASAFAEGRGGWRVNQRSKFNDKITGQEKRLTGTGNSDEEGEARGEESLELHHDVKLALYAVLPGSVDNKQCTIIARSKIISFSGTRTQ